MGRFSQKGDDRYAGEINITPLVDIMFVLLIIFMLVSSFVTQQVIKVNLPKASTGQKDDKKSVAVTVSKEGNLFLDGQSVADIVTLKERVKQEKKRHPELQVVIAADRSVRYGCIVDIIDMVRQLGIRSFAVNVEYKK